jgi:hypothetical protein
MRTIIKIFLVVTLFLASKISFGQNSLELSSIGDKTVHELRLDSLKGGRGDKKFLVRWKYEKNKTTEEEFEIVGVKINPREKKERFYNGRGQLIFEFVYYWDKDLNDYKPSEVYNNSKKELLYNENGKISYEFEYVWDTDKKTFLPWSKEEFKYDEKGNKKSGFGYYWNKELNKFELSWKYERKYDLGGNLIESIFFDHELNKASNKYEFSISSKSIFTYNISFDKQLTQSYELNDKKQTMEETSKSEVRYVFLEGKKFDIKKHFWDSEMLKNKNSENSIITDILDLIDPRENEITKSKFSTKQNESYNYFKSEETNYDDYGIPNTQNEYQNNEITNENYKRSIKSRKILYEDENNIVFQFTELDFDLDFNKWEKDREWQEYYTKVKK